MIGYPDLIMRTRKTFLAFLGFAALTTFLGGCGSSSNVGTTTGSPQVRLVHLIDSLATSPLDLSVAGTEQVSAVAYGKSAVSIPLTASSNATIVVSESSGTTLHTLTFPLTGGTYTFLPYSTTSGGILELDPNVMDLQTGKSGIRFADLSQNNSAGTVNIYFYNNDGSTTPVTTVTGITNSSIPTVTLAPNTYHIQVKTGDGASLLIDTTLTVAASTRYTVVFYGGTSTQRFALLQLTD